MKGLSEAFNRPRDQEVEIWPETLPAINLFAKVLTQWRTSPVGIIGLDYNVIDILMNYDGVPLDKRGDLLSEIACLERGYLSAMRR